MTGTVRGNLVPWNRVDPDQWVVLDFRPQYRMHAQIENYSDQIQMRQWCRDHCRGAYSAHSEGFAFENGKDAFRFQLQYGDRFQ